MGCRFSFLFAVICPRAGPSCALGGEVEHRGKMPKKITNANQQADLQYALVYHRNAFHLFEFLLVVWSFVVAFALLFHQGFVKHGAYVPTIALPITKKRVAQKSSFNLKGQDIYEYSDSVEKNANAKAETFNFSKLPHTEAFMSR